MTNDNFNLNQIHPLEQSETKNNKLKNVIIYLVLIIFGIGTGYGINTFTNKTKTTTNTTNVKTESESNDTTGASGIKDEKTFKDSAEGLLKEGGIDGEGQFHLERAGGESQNVYLTSSTIDLSKYVGKKVKVWGQTFSSQKAGWLMDVGLIK